MIKQFTKFGYSCSAVDVAIGTTYSVIEITNLAANKKSSVVPDDCFLESIEFELSAIATGDTIKMYISRDSGGHIPLTSDQLGGATQAVTKVSNAATTGGVSFTINKDYHFDTTASNSTSGKLYVVALANAACVAENIRLNWRA
tara:strand:- start:642 stop:1073 length:432 start_codon:yes stop_codon:yes gene_type:complete